MRVAQVKISRSEHHAVQLLLGAWEIPALQYEFGPEKVSVLGFKKITGRGYPDAAQEFDRLSLRYGIDTDNGSTKAAMTYGQGAMGVATLRNLIEQEQKLEATEELEPVNFALNVVPNVVAAELIAANPIPGEVKSTGQEGALAALLAEALAQNKAMAEQLAKVQAPAAEGPAAEGPAEKPVLRLKGGAVG